MRLAAGRARALGLPTRGTTAPNRLRRVDRWLATGAAAAALRAAADPLVVDLGFGASAVTLRELAGRLQRVRPDVRLVGVELDPDRVEAARREGLPEGVSVVRGGFEMPVDGAPVLVRAMNVLRQYDERSAAAAWASMTARLAPGGLVVEGTCDEIGRRASWVALGPDGQARSLTLSAQLAALPRPSALAERLPKALISRNVPGEPVHAWLTALDQAWDAEAALGVFGPRQRFQAAVGRVRGEGWPVLDGAARWRLGEVGVAWSAVAPGGQVQRRAGGSAG